MATDVSLDSNVTITFSEKVKGIDDKNITLIKPGSTIPLTYALTNDNNTTLTLNPTNLFDFNTKYTLSIEKIEDNAGNVISPTTSTFETIPRPSLNGRYLKTGQNTCYDTNNAQIPCTSQTVDKNATGQDGYYKKGVDRSYTRVELNATAGIVVDNVTGLMWQDEEYTQAEAIAYNSNTEIGKVLYWVNAKTYCDELTLGGYTDWKLPNINELETIVDYGRAKGDTASSLGAINPIFKYLVQASYINYWSSTTRLSDDSYAWYVTSDDGFNYWGSKSTLSYVRCVR